MEPASNESTDEDDHDENVAEDDHDGDVSGGDNNDDDDDDDEDDDDDDDDEDEDDDDDEEDEDEKGRKMVSVFRVTIDKIEHYRTEVNMLDVLSFEQLAKVVCPLLGNLADYALPDAHDFIFTDGSRNVLSADEATKMPWEELVEYTSRIYVFDEFDDELQVARLTPDNNEHPMKTINMVKFTHIAEMEHDILKMVREHPLTSYKQPDGYLCLYSKTGMTAGSLTRGMLIERPWQWVVQNIKVFAVDQLTSSGSC